MMCAAWRRPACQPHHSHDFLVTFFAALRFRNAIANPLGASSFLFLLLFPAPAARPFDAESELIGDVNTVKFVTEPVRSIRVEDACDGDPKADLRRAFLRRAAN